MCNLEVELDQEMEQCFNCQCMPEEKTERKYKAHNKEHMGILHWLFKNGYCSKQTFGDWLIHTYVETVSDQEFTGIKAKSIFIQEDFPDFMDWVKKNYKRIYK